jgi:hypothetical protein
MSIIEFRAMIKRTTVQLQTTRTAIPWQLSYGFPFTLTETWENASKNGD